jgi:uncharacterized membrane protein YvbJ
MPPETCPNCGADLEPTATVCPECGSDESTGWAEDAYAAGLDLPEDDFNYNEFIEKEFGSKPGKAPRRMPWIWWATALVLVGIFLFFFLRMF